MHGGGRDLSTRIWTRKESRGERTRRRRMEGMKRNERVAGIEEGGKNGETRTKGASPGWRCTSSGHWHETVHFYRGGEGERDGNPADSMAVHFPSPGATYFAKLRSFVRSFPSTRRVLVLFSTTCIRREQRFFQRNRCSNPSFEKENRHALIELHRWIGLNVR